MTVTWPCSTEKWKYATCVIILSEKVIQQRSQEFTCRHRVIRHINNNWRNVQVEIHIFRRSFMNFYEIYGVCYFLVANCRYITRRKRAQRYIRIYAAVNWSMHSFIDARRSSETDRRRSKQKRLARRANEHVALSIARFETIFYRRRGIIYRWPVAWHLASVCRFLSLLCRSYLEQRLSSDFFDRELPINRIDTDSPGCSSSVAEWSEYRWTRTYFRTTVGSVGKKKKKKESSVLNFTRLRPEFNEELFCRNSRQRVHKRKRERERERRVIYSRRREGSTMEDREAIFLSEDWPLYRSPVEPPRRIPHSRWIEQLSRD